MARLRIATGIGATVLTVGLFILSGAFLYSQSHVWEWVDNPDPNDMSMDEPAVDLMFSSIYLFLGVSLGLTSLVSVGSLFGYLFARWRGLVGLRVTVIMPLGVVGSCGLGAASMFTPDRTLDSPSGSSYEITVRLPEWLSGLEWTGVGLVGIGLLIVVPLAVQSAAKHGIERLAAARTDQG